MQKKCRNCFKESRKNYNLADNGKSQIIQELRPRQTKIAFLWFTCISIWFVLTKYYKQLLIDHQQVKDSLVSVISSYSWLVSALGGTLGSLTYVTTCCKYFQFTAQRQSNALSNQLACWLHFYQQLQCFTCIVFIIYVAIYQLYIYNILLYFLCKLTGVTFLGFCRLQYVINQQLLLHCNINQEQVHISNSKPVYYSLEGRSKISMPDKIFLSNAAIFITV